MVVEQLVSDAFLSIWCSLVSQGLWTAADQGWEALKRNWANDTDKEPFIRFIDAVRNCWLQAVRKNGEDEKAFAAMFDVAFRDVTERYSSTNNAQHDMVFHPYLPLSEPIASLRAALEVEMERSGIREDRIPSLLLDFNMGVLDLRQDARLDGIIRQFEYDDGKRQKIGYLQEILQLQYHTIADDDLPLHSAFIKPVGVLCDCSQWGNCSIDDSSYVAMDTLCDQYFACRKDASNTKRILFIGADFGIGKSSYLRMKAVSMANAYLRTWDSLFPVFFSLKECNGDASHIRNELKQCVPDDGTPVCLLLDALDESGPVNDEHARHIFQAVEACLSDLPPGTQCIITSRLILGPRGAVANHIQNVLQHGRNNQTYPTQYIRIQGFVQTNQVDSWINKQRDAHPDIWKEGITHESLTSLGLNTGELEKPLYLWIVGKLLSDAQIDFDTPLPMGRTGLYLRFMNYVSVHCKRPDPKADLPDHRCKARHLLRRLARLRSLLPEEHGITTELVKKHFPNDSTEYEFYKKLDETHFLNLSYFGQNHTAFEFSHLSFQEYLLAEDLLANLLIAAASDSGKKEKYRLITRVVSEETRSFLAELAMGLGKIPTSDVYKDMFEPFLAACDAASKSFAYARQDMERLLNDVLSMAALWVADERPMILEEHDRREHDATCLGHGVKVISRPISDDEMFQERWLALLMGKKICEGMDVKDFLTLHERIVGDSMKSLIEVVVEALPQWKGALLEKAVLDGVRGRRKSFSNDIQIIDGNPGIVGANLSNADLIEADLRDADLRDADLRDADLIEADLRFAGLRKADLSFAGLRSANLIEADLSNADLSNADLRKADLRKADLHFASLLSADLRKANLHSADLIGADLIGADLSEADLRNANLRDANLIGADLRDANLTGAILDDDQKQYLDSIGVPY
ncbi:pentapeptide repeat-containing protein [Desulfovibrio inopinatus]|uniref:pentapeptide repeat-containing protein n=1 Tax=Desulfovibrio inopinatus TaxID=102109 RepID=UPI0004287232|nr:pentapeptide repeat-containing protein [Desulfovibrio inopinatus]